MGDISPLKLILIAGAIIAAFLGGVGVMINLAEDSPRAWARQQQFNMARQAVKQAQALQELNRLKMEARIRAIEEGEYEGYDPFEAEARSRRLEQDFADQMDRFAEEAYGQWE